jgi:xanthine dehydrogenase accessory factor
MFRPAGKTALLLDDVFTALVRLRGERVACALCTVVRTAGSTPRKSTARMLVLEGGSIVGTIGGGRVEREVTEAALALLAQGERARPQVLRYHLTYQLGMCCGGEMEVFVEPMIPDPPLIVCGGGHVARALVPLARQVGFWPILVEDLEELGNKERFPDAARIIDSFDVRDWAGVPLDERTYVVIMTRDHRQDQDLVEALVMRDLAYLGMIGSRRKVTLFSKRLVHKGISEERLARLHAPIGLSIGAETPEEIAVSIVGELIQVRAAARAPEKRKTEAEAAPAGPAEEDE